MQNNRQLFAALTAVTGLVVVIAGCETVQTKPDFYPQAGAPNTLTYKDTQGKEQTVFDLTGVWITRVNAEEVKVRIEQVGNQFKGYMMNFDPGYLNITGKIEGNLVLCDTHLTDRTVVFKKSRLSENVNVFECVGTHQREYKRID